MCIFVCFQRVTKVHNVVTLVVRQVLKLLPGTHLAVKVSISKNLFKICFKICSNLERLNYAIVIAILFVVQLLFVLIYIYITCIINLKLFDEILFSFIPRRYYAKQKFKNLFPTNPSSNVLY